MERERLGRLVYERRRELGLSISAAARNAGINRATWTAIEDASRDTETYNYGPVERVLGWAPGSIDDIVAGGEPTVQPPVAPKPVPAPPEPAPAEREPAAMSPRNKAIIRVMESKRVPEAEKRRIVDILLADQAAARVAEEQRRMTLAEELMRPWEETG